MKKDKRFRQFEVAILNTEYKVYVCIGDREKANRAIQGYFQEKLEFVDNIKRGVTVYHKGFHPYIWTDGTLDFTTGVATLAHEAIHAVTHIMDYLGMDMKDDSGNEFLAHSVAAILRKCLPDKK